MILGMHTAAAISLTVKQAQTLKALRDLRKELKYSPTYRELASFLDCDPTTLHRSIQVLQLKGAVERPNGPRSLQPTAAGLAALREFETASIS